MKATDIMAGDLRMFVTSNGLPVATQAALADTLRLSTATVHRYIDAMRPELGKRYPTHAIARPTNNTILVSIAAFWDYLCYGDALRDRNLRKQVPKYDPKEILSGLGISFTIAA